MNTGKQLWIPHQLPKASGLLERLLDAMKRDQLASFQVHVDKDHPNVIWSGYIEGEGISKPKDYGRLFGRVWLEQEPKWSSSHSNFIPDQLLLLPEPNYDPMELERCLEGLLDRPEWLIDDILLEASEEDGGMRTGYLLEQGGKGAFDDSSPDLPENLPFRKFHQAFEDNRVWYPWLYDHPWRGFSQWAFKSLVSAAPDALADDDSWVIWDSPGQGGVIYQVQKAQVRRERIEIRPAQVKKLSTDGFNEKIQIPLRLVRDDVGKGRRLDGRIYLFQQEPEDEVLPAGVIRILDHAQAGQREFRYQALKEKSRAQGMRGRTWHIFHEEQIAEHDEEALVPWARIFELPTHFAEQGHQIFLEQDVRFRPNLERFPQEVVKEHLEKITANLDVAKGKLILLEADSERNPNAWVLDDEKFDDAREVIQAIVTSFQPDILERSPDEALNKSAINVVAVRGEAAVNLVENAHKELEDRLAKAFQLVDERAATVKAVLERAIGLLKDVENHDSKIETLANEHLKKGWDPFALEVGKHHKHTLDESRKWATRVVDDILATCETATSTVTESENRRKEVKDAGKRLDVAANNLKEALELCTEMIARSGEALEKAKSKRDEQNKEVENKKAAFQRDQQEAQACLKQMEEADSRVRAEIRKISEEANKVVREEEVLAKELAKRQRERWALEQKKSQLLDTKRTLEDTKAEIEKLIITNKRLEAEIEDLNKQHLAHQLGEARKKSQALSSEKEQLENTKRQLGAELKSQAKQKDELTRQKGELTRLKSEIASVRSSCKTLMSEVEKLQEGATEKRLKNFEMMKHLLISAAKKLDDRNLLQRLVALFKRGV